MADDEQAARPAGDGWRGELEGIITRAKSDRSALAFVRVGTLMDALESAAHPGQRDGGAAEDDTAALRRSWLEHVRRLERDNTELADEVQRLRAAAAPRAAADAAACPNESDIATSDIAALRAAGDELMDAAEARHPGHDPRHVNERYWAAVDAWRSVAQPQDGDPR